MTYQNPILYADYSDPDVIRVGEDYYMVASSFTYLPGVPLLHSRDLVHWEIINYCVPELPFEKYNRPSHGSGTWAPSIRYHDGTFFVFVPLVDEGIFVARSKDPRGTFTLNCLQEAKGWIDPCPLWDEDGKTYMVFAYARSRCGIKHRLAVVEIDRECTKLLGVPRTIFDGEQIAPTTEGPKFYKRDGRYYIFAPSGGVAVGWQSVLRADSVYGPYEYRIVMHQGNTAVNGPHQGGLVDTPDGKEWFVHFQDVIELGRIVHLQPVCWNGGWPFIGMEANGDGIGEPVSEWTVPVDNAPAYRIVDSDNFAAPTLGLQWQWQANPRPEFYSLTREPGKMFLACLADPQRETLAWYAPNLCTQIPQSPQFTVTAKVALHARRDGDMAALGMLGHAYAYLALEHRGENFLLKLYEGQVLEREQEGLAEEKGETVATLSTDTLWLRLHLSKDKKYTFAFSCDGVNYVSVGKSFPLHRCTWTGAKLFIWATNKEKISSEGYAAYDYVTIDHL